MLLENLSHIKFSLWIKDPNLDNADYFDAVLTASQTAVVHPPTSSSSSSSSSSLSSREMPFHGQANTQAVRGSTSMVRYTCRSDDTCILELGQCMYGWYADVRVLISTILNRVVEEAECRFLKSFQRESRRNRVSSKTYVLLDDQLCVKRKCIRVYDNDIVA